MSKVWFKEGGLWLGHRLRRAVMWVLRFHGSPRQVARGMAIGVLLAFTPPVGHQMIAAIVLATITYSNRAAAVAAVWITNPLTAVPIYLLTYRVGLVFTPNTQPVELRRRLRSLLFDEGGDWLDLGQQARQLLALGTDVLIPLTVGGLIIGLAAGAVAYALTLAVFKYAPVKVLSRRREKRTEGP